VVIDFANAAYTGTLADDGEVAGLLPPNLFITSVI
jgi:hypothetical protein